MATRRQIAAAKRNIKKAQKKWKGMSSRSRTLAQPQGRKRKKPGSTGKGQYYHITVRPKGEFTSFRVQDIGRKGGVQRVAGRKSSGSWATHKWLIEKGDAKKVGRKLIGISKEAKMALAGLGSKAKFTVGDKFTAKPRKNIPEKKKPTRAQKRARTTNIKKAQRARRKKR